MTLEHVVLDASALIDLVCDAESGTAVGERLAGRSVHAPAHLDAEVLSGLGCLHRAGALSGEAVAGQLAAVAAAPIERHPVPALLEGAWSRRAQLRLADALYVELAHQIGAPLITTDARLGRAIPIAEIIAP